MSEITYRKRMTSEKYEHQSVAVDAYGGSVYIGTSVPRRSEAGGFYGAHIPPGQARRLARWLLKAADRADAAS